MNSAIPGITDDPTPEQMMTLLQSLQAAGHNLDEISPDLSELMRKVKKEKGQPTEDIPLEEITPEPCFVIKTADTKDGTKVFINVCASDKVPAPGNWKTGQMPEEVEKALENRDNGENSESLRFPLSCGQPKTDMDRKGIRCLTCDCIVNADVLKQAGIFRPLKAFLIELALGWVGHKTGMELDPKFKLPKMKYKGEEVEKQNIRVERKPLVCEVMDIEEDPTFPLVTKKPKQPAVPPPGASDAPSKSTPKRVGSNGSATDVSEQRGYMRIPQERVSHVSSSSSPALQSHRPEPLKHTIEYINRPVDEILVTVNLPEALSKTTGLSGDRDAGSVGAEVCGKTLHVTAPGCIELHVPLPFALEPERSSVLYDASMGRLEVRLKIRSVRGYLEALRQEKPLAFGQIGLGSNGLLELE